MLSEASLQGHCLVLQQLTGDPSRACALGMEGHVRLLQKRLGFLDQPSHTGFHMMSLGFFFFPKWKEYINCVFLLLKKKKKCSL